MKTLTRAEEEIMQIIWDLGPCTVANIRDAIEEKSGPPKPPHSTISTMVRILDDKGFLGHKAYGRTYEYFPLVTRENYSKQTLRKMITDYFEGSPNRLVSFQVQENDLSLKDLSELMDQLEDDEPTSTN